MIITVFIPKLPKTGWDFALVYALENIGTIVGNNIKFINGQCVLTIDIDETTLFASTILYHLQHHHCVHVHYVCNRPSKYITLVKYNTRRTNKHFHFNVWENYDVDDYLRMDEMDVYVEQSNALVNDFPSFCNDIDAMLELYYYNEINKKVLLFHKLFPTSFPPNVQQFWKTFVDNYDFFEPYVYL